MTFTKSIHTLTFLLLAASFHTNRAYSAPPEPENKPPPENKGEGITNNFQTDERGERFPLCVKMPEKSVRYPCAIDRKHPHTFEVTPKHERLADGVQFTIEDRPPASAESLAMKNITEEEYQNKINKRINNFYKSEKKSAKIIACSKKPTDLVSVCDNAIAKCILKGYNDHIKVSLNACHLWALVVHAFGIHVNLNSEKLRHHFVDFEGKKDLEIILPGDSLPSTPEEWESNAFEQFNEAIGSNINPDLHKILTEEFSNTTPTEKACSHIVHMSTNKKYFNYTMGFLCCGIPEIKLEGTEEDWVALRNRTEALSKYMVPDFAESWIPKLLPIMDKVIKSYQGDVDHGFWQTIVKKRVTHGSGGYAIFTGWFKNLFPYLKKNKLNPYMSPWDESTFTGPDLNDMPAITSSAPVKLKQVQGDVEFDFHSQLMGVRQDPTTGTLSTALGWVISQPINKEAIQAKW